MHAITQIIHCNGVNEGQHHAGKNMDVNEGLWKHVEAHESLRLASMARLLVRKVRRARTPSHVWACPHPISIRSTVENTASVLRKKIDNLKI